MFVEDKLLMKNIIRLTALDKNCFPLLLLIFLLTGNTAIASIIHVNSISSLQTAVNNSHNGDSIMLANGTYLNNVINISSNNITVLSASAGGVFLNGTEAISISGNHVTFSGFQFTSGINPGIIIDVTGNNNVLTQLNFNGFSAQKYIKLAGVNNTISYSNFENKPIAAPAGDLIQIDASATVIGYNKIRYCSFKHMQGAGGDNGNECIRIGEGIMSTFVSRTVVEYCYFEDTGPGDSEAISVKSRENCLRFNTMNNNPNAMFVFRNGGKNIAYGNFFIASGGIRCKEANDIYCYNNYFEKSGIGQGLSTRPVYLEYFGQGFGNNFNFFHNTFYKCNYSEIQSGLTNVTWANNIFFQNTENIFTGTSSGNTFTGNIYQGNTGIVIASGMTSINPLLVINADGYYGLSSNSPAIDASNASYPVIPVIAGINQDSVIAIDIQGQARPSSRTLKDIGCDEYSATEIINHPPTACNTGPNYEIISANAGNWDNPATWAGGIVPSCNDRVIVKHAVVVLSNENCYSLSVEHLNGSLLVKSGFSLNILH